jgi:hypothetical protein
MTSWPGHLPFGNQKRFWGITLAAEFDYKMQPKYNNTYWSTKYENLNQ